MFISLHGVLYMVNVYLVYISHYPDNSGTIHVIPIICLLLPIEIRFILLSAIFVSLRQIPKVGLCLFDNQSKFVNFMNYAGNYF